MKTIVAALDFSDVTARVIEVAREMAQALRARLYLLHVEPPDPDFVGYEPGPEHVRNQVAQDAIRHFKQENTLRDELRAQGVDAHSLVIQGPTAEKIVNEAEKLEADLIIVGSHGHGAVYHVVMGSVGEGVVNRAACPVLVVPSRKR
jgi:nucleotide-binding universal stress UspA family protein